MLNIYGAYATLLTGKVRYLLAVCGMDEQYHMWHNCGCPLLRQKPQIPQMTGLSIITVHIYWDKRENKRQ